MNIHVHIHDGPLPDCPAEPPASPGDGDAGASLCFEGLVRAREEGRQISGLEYEVYEPMAERELERLAEIAARVSGVLDVSVEHSRGCVPVGERAFRLRVAAVHRAEALRAVAEFIDGLKRDVPIWKKPIYASRTETHPAVTERRAPDAPTENR